jgi:putative ABC transport system permease protein
VALINETLAKRYWPNEDAIGKRITLAFAGPPVVREIVGVVGDVRREGLDRAPLPGVYLPHAQTPTGAITFTVRTSGDAMAAARAVRKEIAALLPAMPVSSTTTLELLLDDSLRERRFSLLLLGVFSLTALALAAVGTYGVMSQATSERTAEIGVRMALGARAKDVVGLVLRQGGALALGGVALGLLGAAVLTRGMRAMLYAVTPGDPLALGGAALLLIAAAGVACWVPARRATAVQPVEALRAE